MAIQFKEFTRPAFSGDAEEMKKKVTKYCNSELKCFRIISISEAKGMTDDFYRITVWYDDEAEKYEHLLASETAESLVKSGPDSANPPESTASEL